MKKSTQQLVLLAAVTAGIVLLLTGSSTRPTESYTEHLPPGAKHAQHEILGEHHVNLWDPRKCVVIGLAVGYGMEEMELFIGSLRATGYPGKIIIGVASDVPVEVKDYLEEQRVETKVVKFGPCTFQNYTKKDGTLAEKYNKKQKCDIDHPDYKIQWGRFNLAAKWLQECADCTDGVMFTDVRDAFFQRDPFAAVQHPHDLMVFEEHQDVSTEHWLVDFPVTACKGRGVGKQPMLCSGSTMGSRGGMLTYFAAMDAEFRAWISDPKCRFDLVCVPQREASLEGNSTCCSCQNSLSSLNGSDVVHSVEHNWGWSMTFQVSFSNGLGWVTLGSNLNVTVSLPLLQRGVEVPAGHLIIRIDRSAVLSWRAATATGFSSITAHRESRNN
eukprot:m.874644 g.874644  ORF g.874644 m.874644 type:complete len:385 (-) comp23576_c0_seq17:315-1469(-)